MLDSFLANRLVGGKLPSSQMPERKQSTVGWIDALWLLFILGLALLPPIAEIHKQITLVAIGVFQFFEGRLVGWQPKRGPIYIMAIKIALATLLLDHTGDLGINSSYYQIYYLPVVTAAIYFGPIATLLWTALASLAYMSFLIPALQDYELTAEGATTLATRILFFFLAAILVNRFVIQNKKQVQLYQSLSETLEETNRQLRRAEADARRSERLAALGQLSAGLAHEIRNPLGVIKGSAEMLVQKLQGAQPLVGELAGYIYSEVNRLNALVSRFLDFARPLSVELQPRQVTAILDRSLKSVQNQFPEAGVRVERNYAPDLPNVLADEQLCERVFINLITNAFQAMGGVPDGQKIVRVSAVAESSGGRRGAGVVIEDMGPGVPAELREQIFNPFVTSKKDGVGLGLSIVAKIVDEHRGWIKLENEAGRGARFHVFLPTES
jgi:two-component system, NtrC family, sensor histidine kinase HydH